ncbi:MBOAT family O-acyltransferase [Treponema sp.]
MLLSIVSNYYLGLAIDNTLHTNKHRRLFFIVAVIFNLSLLGIFKYSNFIIGNLNIFSNLLSLPEIHILNISLPIGISFYTFQALSYIFDLYRKEIHANDNIFELGLYITLFPQLIAGPIVRYQDIQNEIRFRKSIDIVNFKEGIERFIIGLSKKVLLANTLGSFADSVFNLETMDLNFSLAWVGVLSYTLQIYFDFSGYSCMAIGLGKMLGFTFLENFNYPYIASSIKDFWHRWHISLSTWFKDYLYIPLGGNRLGIARENINKSIVFILCGLWHGASWSFVIWGAYHGMLQLLETIPYFKSIRKKTPKIVNIMITFLLVAFGWVLFRSDSMEQAKDIYIAMFNIFNFRATSYLTIPASAIIALFFGTIAMIPWLNYIPGLLKIRKNALFSLVFLFLFILDSLFLASSTYNPFIYFRF